MKHGGERVNPGLVAGLIVALLVLVALTFLFRLGSVGLMDPDEPRYAGSAREMLESGDYWIPRFNGEVRIVKPILPYWSILAGYRFFGVGELGARAPSAAAGILTLLLTGLLGARLYGRRVGFLASVLLSVSVLHVAVSRLATPDAALAFFVTASLTAFAFLYERTGRGTLLKVAMFAAAAMGFLVKGPVAILVPGIAILGFLATRRDLGFARRLGLPWGIPLFLALALPWFVVVALDSDAGASGVFLSETLSRYFGSEDYHRKPVYYLIGVAFLGFFPWSLHLGFGARFLLRRSEEGAPGVPGLLPWWIGTVLVFFSLSPNKLPAYVLPLGPPVVILAAREFERRILRGHADLAGRASGLVEGALMLGAVAAAWFILGRDHPDARRAALPLLVFVAVMAMAMAGMSLRGAPRLLLVGRVAVMAVVLLYTLVVLAPFVEAERSYKDLETVLAPRIQESDLLVEGWFHQPGLVFYAHHRVIRLDSVEGIRRNMEKPRRMYCLVEEKNFPPISEALRTPPVVLHRARGKILFTNGGP